MGWAQLQDPMVELGSATGALLVGLLVWGQVSLRLLLVVSHDHLKG